MTDDTEFLERLRYDLYGVFAGFLEILNPDLLGHSKRVAKGARALAQVIGWPKHVVQRVYMGGLLHDLGYLAISNQAHQRWNAIENEEPDRENIQEAHPVLGEKVLRRVTSLQEIRPIVRHHHEHYDGSGYPDGLKGKDIPAEARLVSIVDFYERVTVVHSGQSIMAAKEAELILREDAGIIYDPKMVPLFLEKVVPSGVMLPPDDSA